MATTLVDMHVHVGLRGDRWPHWGHFSDAYMRDPVFDLFLLYAGLRRGELTDETIHVRTVDVIMGATSLDHVVCLALDPAYDARGNRLERECHMWVANDYVARLAADTGGKALMGASVHPFDPAFKGRVAACVAQGAVLLKWLPSAQHINLADPRVRAALTFLATAGKGGGPLPLLLHVGYEGAIPPVDRRAKSYDYLSWSPLEDLWNRLVNRWHRPDAAGALTNLREGLDAGATIILAHAGLPYFASGILGFLEHSDFPVVRRLVAERGPGRGRCYADVSAVCTPFRRPFFRDLAALPAGALLAGSDFPVPLFELSGGVREGLRDIERAIRTGDARHLVVPQGNLLDVNVRELKAAFGAAHPMFTNFAQLLPPAGGPATAGGEDHRGQSE